MTSLHNRPAMPGSGTLRVLEVRFSLTCTGIAAERSSSGKPSRPRTRWHVHNNCDGSFRSRNLRPAHHIHTHRCGASPQVPMTGTL